MGNKILKKEFDPKYGWVTADTKQSSGFTQFEKAAKLYKETYGVDPNPKATSWTKGKMDEELLRWYKSATNPNVTNNPTSKKLMDLQAKGIADPVALKAAKKDPAALPYWQQYTVQKGKKTVPLTIKDIKSQTPPEDFDKSRDTLAAAQLRDPSKKYYSNATTKALKSAQRIEGNVKFEQLLRADPTNYTDVVLTRYYDSPNATLKSRNGRAFVNVGGPKNISKSLGGEDLADETFKYYQGLAKAGELGQDWAAVDGNQYLQKGTFGGKEAYFTPYDYAIHGVPTGERGREVVTNIASLDPNYWRTAGNLQKIGDKYGFVTEANPFAAQVGGTNQQLTPEEVAFVQSTKKKKGLGGLGGGLSSLLTLGGQMLIGGPGALNPFGSFNPSVFAFGIPNTLASVAGLGAGSNPKSPKTWTRTLQTPQWQPQQPAQPMAAQQPAQPMAAQPQQQTTQPVQMAQGGMVGNTMNFNPVQAGNPVAQTAQGLASLGRNNDSMLMHVTPNEVAGLQGLAQQMGGSLTINPQTGLPEAGFLDGIGDFLVNLLPTAAGTAVGFGTGNPLLGAAVAGGLKTAQTGDIGQGILSGIGAYTGTGTVGDIAKMGAQSAATTGSGALASGEGLANTMLGAPSIGANMSQVTSTMPTAITGATGELGSPLMQTGFNAVEPAASSLAIPETVYPSLTGSPIGQGGLALGSGATDLTQLATTAAAPSFSDFTSGLSALTGPGGFTQFAQQTGSSPLGAGFKLASPFIGAGVETLAQQGALMPEMPGGMSGGFGQFTPIEELRKRYSGNVRMAQGGMVPKQFGVSNQQGITALPIGQVSQPFQTFTGYNPTNPEPVSNAPEYNSVSSGLNARFKQGGYLDGNGDGMSDDIPATIEGKQPARLADGEFVVAADVVSHLGNGSTKAGAKRLYAMMDKVRQARTGTKKQGKKINADKFLPT